MGRRQRAEHGKRLRAGRKHCTFLFYCAFYLSDGSCACDERSKSSRTPQEIKTVHSYAFKPVGHTNQRVSLVQIPGKEELRQKNLFSVVSDCKVYWQNNGEYLAVKVDRYTKTKKSTYTGFELFRIKERDILMERLTLDRITINLYIATAVTSVHEMENGFHIWSFNGKLLYRVSGIISIRLGETSFPNDIINGMELLRNLLSLKTETVLVASEASLLSAEKEEEIAKNLKKYSKKYEAEDQDVSMQLNEQDRKKEEDVAGSVE